MSTKPTKFVLVTGNKGKLAEFRHFLGDDVIDSQQLDLPELQGSMYDIVAAKVEEAYRRLQCPVIVEDTSLCFKAWSNNLPGPYIKWFLQEMGLDGLYDSIKDKKNHSGRAVCLIGIKLNADSKPIVLEGSIDCTIVSPRSTPGSASFGWDPICEIDGKTLAEMSLDEKNKVSHRAIALQKLRDFIAQNQCPF